MMILSPFASGQERKDMTNSRSIYKVLHLVEQNLYLQSFYLFIYLSVSIDFKMEHMSVQIQEPGVVTITGESPLDDTRRSRFRKQIRIPKDSKTDEIQANLYGDVLHVVVPRKTPALPATKSCTKTSTITASMPSNYLFGLIKSAISRLEMNTMLALPVAGVLAMVVAFVGYAYKYCHCGDAES
ncbi:hypothetical protein NC652_040880 [Populus alba x Populus x berolinensis]|nr:hypothetical protein NC652_040880 [Populus alba x Populus x berolinensis]